MSYGCCKCGRQYPPPRNCVGCGAQNSMIDNGFDQPQFRMRLQQVRELRDRNHNEVPDNQLDGQQMATAILKILELA